jgi:hypothetical protein
VGDGVAHPAQHEPCDPDPTVDGVRHRGRLASAIGVEDDVLGQKLLQGEQIAVGAGGEEPVGQLLSLGR